MGMHQSAGGEYCTLSGAKALLQKIATVRQAQGVPCNLMVARVGEDRGGHAVYGLRERVEPVAVVAESRARARYTGWQAQAKHLCANVLALHHKGVTLADVLGPARQRHIVNARHACLRACYAADIADSVRALARMFNVTEMVVWRAVKPRPSRARVQ